MDKIFLYRKHAKTSENCNKLSKSVSYETLVGGTPTTCTAHKQTQCLSKGSADYRFCKTMRFSYENLVDRLLQTSPVFRLVKVLTLAAVLSMGMLSESWADCLLPTNGICKTLKTSGGSCGKGCSYTYNADEETVYITASGDARMNEAAFYRIFYENNIMAKNFVIDGALSIGSNAFTTTEANITGTNGSLVLNNVEHHAFGDNATLNGNIIITKDATFGSLAFHGVTLAQGAKIYCNVENCAQKMLDACEFPDMSYQTRCYDAVNAFIDDETAFEQAPDGCDYWSQNGCSKCSGPSFKLEDHYCLRKIYTPAEAAEVLKDTDNEIIMTFKVNR